MISLEQQVNISSRHEETAVLTAKQCSTITIKTIKTTYGIAQEHHADDNGNLIVFVDYQYDPNNFTILRPLTRVERIAFDVIKQIQNLSLILYRAEHEHRIKVMELDASRLENPLVFTATSGLSNE